MPKVLAEIFKIIKNIVYTTKLIKMSKKRIIATCAQIIERSCPDIIKSIFIWNSKNLKAHNFAT